MAPKAAQPPAWTTVTKAQLPSEWLERPPKRVYKEWARKLGCSVDKVEIMVAVTMPQCQASTLYMRWIDAAHAAGALQPTEDDVSTMMENTDTWVVANECSVERWTQEFLDNGHPPVRFLAHAGFQKQ